MVGAVVKNNIVQTLVIINPEQVDGMQTALGAEIVDARPYGLTIGDLRTANGWTRNAGGEQMILPLLEPDAYDSYTIAEERAAAAEARLDSVAEATAAEALAILHGEDDGE